MSTSFKLRGVPVSGWLSLLLSACLVVLVSASEPEDIAARLDKDIEALQGAVKAVRGQLSRFKPPMNLGKPSGFKPRGKPSQPPGVKPAVKPSKLRLPVSVDKMEKLVWSLSRTISESGKKYRKAHSNRQLGSSMKSLEDSFKLLVKAKKRGDKAGAEKALRQISSTLSTMKKQSKLLAVDVKKLTVMKLDLEKPKKKQVQTKRYLKPKPLGGGIASPKMRKAFDKALRRATHLTSKQKAVFEANRDRIILLLRKALMRTKAFSDYRDALKRGKTNFSPGQTDFSAIMTKLKQAMGGALQLNERKVLCIWQVCWNSWLQCCEDKQCTNLDEQCWINYILTHLESDCGLVTFTPEEECQRQNYNACASCATTQCSKHNFSWLEDFVCVVINTDVCLNEICP